MEREKQLLERQRNELNEKLGALTGGFGFEVQMKIQEKQSLARVQLGDLGLSGSSEIEKECTVCFEREELRRTACPCALLICVGCFARVKQECPVCKSKTRLLPNP